MAVQEAKVRAAAERTLLQASLKGVFALVVMTSVLDGVMDKIAIGFSGMSWDGTVVIQPKTAETTEEQKRFGSSYAEVLRNPYPDPLIRGGTTRRIPFTLAVTGGARPARIQAVLSSALLPEPGPTQLEQYLASLPSDRERAEAKRLLTDYALPTLLTFRSRTLEGKEMMP